MDGWILSLPAPLHLPPMAGSNLLQNLCILTVTSCVVDLKPDDLWMHKVSQWKTRYIFGVVHYWADVLCASVKFTIKRARLWLNENDEPFIVIHTEYNPFTCIYLGPLSLISKSWSAISMFGRIFVLGRHNPGHISKSLTPIGRTARILFISKLSASEFILAGVCINDDASCLCRSALLSR